MHGACDAQVRDLSGGVSKEVSGTPSGLAVPTSRISVMHGCGAWQVLDAMSQLISRILSEMNTGVDDTPMEAPLPKLRELLVWQVLPARPPRLPPRAATPQRQRSVQPRARREASPCRDTM